MTYGYKLIRVEMSGDLWGDYLDIMFPAPYQVRRKLFRWAVGRDNFIQGGWVAERYFWKRDNATAYLVELALRGHKVEL